MFDPEKPNWVDKLPMSFNRNTHQVMMTIIGFWIAAIIGHFIGLSSSTHYALMTGLSTAIFLYGFAYFKARKRRLDNVT